MSDSVELTVHFATDKEQVEQIKEKRIYATLNAAVFMINQVERRYNELTTMLQTYNRSKEGSVKVSQVTIDISYPHGNYIVSLAWDIVDWCDRLRKILGAIAGVRRKENWYQQLVTSLEATAEVRHFLQHYNREIKNFVAGSYPLMGSVSACFPLESGWHTRCIPSTPLTSVYHRDFKVSGFQVPPYVEGDIDYVMFSIAEKYINITELTEKLRVSKVNFCNYLEIEYGFVWPEF